MTNHASKLESTCRRELARSELDREDSIAFLLVQLQKDLAASRRFRDDVISWLKNLKGIVEVDFHKFKV